MEKVAKQRTYSSLNEVPRQLAEKHDESNLRQRLENVKSQKEKDSISEEYIFGKHYEVLDAKSELQD